MRQYVATWKRCLAALFLLASAVPRTTAQENVANLRLREVGQLSGHATDRAVAIRGLGLSHDGSRGAYIPQWAGSGRIGTHPPIVWDLSNGRLSHRLGGRADIGALDLTVSKSGRLIASEGLKGAYWWDVETGRSTKLIDARDRFSVNSLRFSHDEKKLATSHSSGQLFVWELSSRDQLHALDGAGGVTRFSPDDSMLVAATADLEVKIWDLKNPGFPKRLKFESSIPRTAQTRSIRGGSTVVRAWIRALEYAPDGKSIGALAGFVGRPWHYCRWDPRTETVLFEQKLGKRPSAVAILPDGQTAAVGEADGSVGLWNLSTGKIISEVKSHSKLVSGIAVSGDGTRLLSGGADLRVVFYDIASE